MKIMGRSVTSVALDRWSRRRWARHELVDGEPELALVALLADPAGVFVDVGANAGAYAFAAAGNFAEVIAIEANPRVADDLARLLPRNARVLQLGLSDHVGEATFWIPQTTRGDLDTRGSLQRDANPDFEQREVTVPLTTLDDLALPRVAVVKVDVEGHELPVLQGAVRTLRSERPVCIVESEERHNPGATCALFAFFADLGYAGWFLHRDQWRSTSTFDPDVHQRPEAAKQIEQSKDGSYINNFVFVPFDRPDLLDRLGIPV